jgi:hypothetical protein
MSQSYLLPTVNDAKSTAIATLIPNCLEALRTIHSGGTAPTATIAYMLWLDTSAGIIKMRDSTNTSWINFLPHSIAQRIVVVSSFGTVSASVNDYLMPCPSKFVVEKFSILSTTATTGSSSGNEWQFQAKNRTTTTDLFSAAVGTFTSLGGVGGGAEIAVDTAYLLTPNQNQTMNENAVLEWRFVKVGVITTLTQCVVAAYGYQRAT